jgi:hypothetical protein
MTMPYDYTDAPPPRDNDLIPHGTVATVMLHIRAGGVGEDGALRRSKDGACEMLDCEFVVVDGQYAKRKFWENLILEGTTDGHAKSADINRGTIKAILDSAFGLKPDDVSPQARAARTKSLGQLDGLTFMAKISIEKGRPKGLNTKDCWPDKNILAGVITPEKREWRPVEQPPPFNGGNSGTASAAAPSSAVVPIARPGWAT